MEVSVMIWLAIIILQVADAYTTWRIIQAGGYEQNKRMVWLISKVGLRAALIESKGVIIAATGVVLLVWPEPLVHIVMFLLCLWYSWVAWHNAQEMKK